MTCPPVRGDNLRALTGGLSYVQVDKHGRTCFLSHWIRISEILPWDRKLYLPQAILPRTLSNAIM